MTAIRIEENDIPTSRIDKEDSSEIVGISLLNCGILLISHDLHTVMSATDHVVCLNGHVCCSGSPIDVARNNEYKALFGEQASKTLAIYEHKHDHTHSNDGEIKKN